MWSLLKDSEVKAVSDRPWAEGPSSGLGSWLRELSSLVNAGLGGRL